MSKATKAASGSAKAKPASGGKAASTKPAAAKAKPAGERKTAPAANSAGSQSKAAKNGAGKAAGAPAEARKTMYGPVSVLNAKEHGGLQLSPAPDHRFAESMNSVVLAAAEFPQAALHYPIVFAEADGNWSAYAVTGHTNGKNSFIGKDGKWLEGTYIPALIRRYPFVLVADSSQRNLSLAADLSSDMLKGKKGAKLYDDGKPSQTAANILRFCVSFDNQLKASGDLFKRIADSGILVSRRADVTLPDNTKSAIVGFHVVDEQKLADLDDDAFLKLRKDGVLNLIYCHLWSMRSWKNILA
ncbi:SapC family protein [Salaquimonas pukyongi]|uniref:SapC family protein n=1 Tax=Salaquimonas pukyongi TaxID=2712698 RepID=UPI00096B7E0A|nr:SapC family protein [Salaquimonas pukyongi]